MSKQDKEKAHQIGWETSKHYDPLLCKESWCEMAALDMAAWKEQQMIEKAVEYINNTIGQGGWLNSCQINNFIESFKKYMED